MGTATIICDDWTFRLVFLDFDFELTRGPWVFLLLYLSSGKYFSVTPPVIRENRKKICLKFKVNNRQHAGITPKHLCSVQFKINASLNLKALK